ncbi:MAG: AMP-binding protein [bacterium]|nr:AMP-binding protein [bacterium]
MLNAGQLGVHPAGALGVAFFVHARADCIVGRGGDGITQPLKEAGALRLDEGGRLRSVALKGRLFANLLEADARGRMPEVLLVCCNPNQLHLFTEEMTRFVESLAGRGRLRTVEDLRQRVPILLILPNGILSEQTLRTYEEQLNESLLMERLPGVTSEMIAGLLDRVVRGVSLQAGGRRGSGAEAVYVVEKCGSIVFAGGGAFEQGRVAAVLSGHDYPFDHARGVPGTRIEFDKALISIVLNVGGLIHMVEPDGSLSDLRMGDLCQDPNRAPFVQQITRAVFDVGQAAGAYPPEAKYDEVWPGQRKMILTHAGHVTSSVKSFRDALAGGLNSVKLFSNEEWLLTPLARYAANAGMEREAALFKSLRRQVQASMARAIRYRDTASNGRGSGRKAMKLTAQRNIGIELYEAGPDDIVLIGTLLDNEHLIKLEVNVYLPDEQITRAELNMIRVPFPVCHEVETVADNLVGLRIERGVLQEISHRVGGRVGCSHIKELATSIVYFVASNLVRRRAGVDPLSDDYAHKPADERFGLTKELLRDSCLAYCQTTPQALDSRIGIKRVGTEHTHPVPLGDCEPSLGVLLQDRAGRWQDKVYLRWRREEEPQTLTWSEFGGRTFQIARRLIAQGLRAGDRVALVSENRAEMFMMEMAVWSVGAVTVPIFAGYHPPQISYVLHHAHPRYVVVSGRHQLDKIERTEYASVEKYYCMDFDAGCGAWGATDFAELLTEPGVDADALEQRLRAVQPTDLCMVMYTSGTTGPPKGVKLSHLNIISQQKAISLIWDISEQDVFLSYLPWHHSFGGLFERFMTLYNGCELCLDDSRGRDLERLIGNWATFEPTLFFSVPRVHDLLVTRCREDRSVAKMVFSGRLRFVFTAGASLPGPVESVYRAHGLAVLEGWGLTETSPCVTCTTKDGTWKSGYVGLPIPGVTVRIDSDQEILVKGSNVMGGYLDDEDATSRVLEPDGWFRTGDLGEFTPDGLRLLGRKDGAFKLTNGEKVHPMRVENVLINESPYINQLLVVGSGRNFVGALVYPDMSRLGEWATQNALTTDDLMSNPAVRDLFAAEIERINPMVEVKYQRVRRLILADRAPSLAKGELTPSGKIVRKVVFEQYAHQLDDLFADEPSGKVIMVGQPELQRTIS